MTKEWDLEELVDTADKKKAIIVDIDGTLALMNGKRTPFEWDKVYEDDPNLWVISIVKAYLYGNDVKLILLSGRSDECREQTIKWLDEKAFILCNDFKLFMRPQEQLYEKDAKIKFEIYYNHIKPFYDVLFVIDDRKQVVDMWRNVAGLPVAQVAEGNF